MHFFNFTSYFFYIFLCYFYIIISYNMSDRYGKKKSKKEEEDDELERELEERRGKNISGDIKKRVQKVKTEEEIKREEEEAAKEAARIAKEKLENERLIKSIFASDAEKSSYVEKPIYTDIEYDAFEYLLKNKNNVITRLKNEFDSKTQNILRKNADLIDAERSKKKMIDDEFKKLEYEYINYKIKKNVYYEETRKLKNELIKSDDEIDRIRSEERYDIEEIEQNEKSLIKSIKNARKKLNENIKNVIVEENNKRRMKIPPEANIGIKWICEKDKNGIPGNHQVILIVGEVGSAGIIKKEMCHVTFHGNSPHYGSNFSHVRIDDKHYIQLYIIKNPMDKTKIKLNPSDNDNIYYNKVSHEKFVGLKIVHHILDQNISEFENLQNDINTYGIRHTGGAKLFTIEITDIPFDMNLLNVILTLKISMVINFMINFYLDGKNMNETISFDDYIQMTQDREGTTHTFEYEMSECLSLMLDDYTKEQFYDQVENFEGAEMNLENFYISKTTFDTPQNYNANFETQQINNYHEEQYAEPIDERKNYEDEYLEDKEDENEENKEDEYLEDEYLEDEEDENEEDENEEDENEEDENEEDENFKMQKINYYEEPDVITRAYIEPNIEPIDKRRRNYEDEYFNNYNDPNNFKTNEKLNMSAKRNIEDEDNYDELSDSDDYDNSRINKRSKKSMYYLKYLKYKLKYINLKKMLNSKNL